MEHDATGLRLLVLGGVEARRGDAIIDIGGRRQRALLALLILAKGTAVSARRLIDALWPTEPPPKANVALHAYVSHLRRGLEPGRPPRSRSGLIVSQAPGYALRIPADTVDAWRFEEAVTRWSGAVDSDPAGVRAGLTEALALWRGEAYAEYADDGWAVAERTRLRELRSVAQEALLQARINSGETAAVVPELEVLAAEEPLREGWWRLLALALYRSHRQGDALGALRRARAVLAEELGIDPGPGLRALESDILAQSASLNAPVSHAPVVPAPSPDGPELHGRQDVVQLLAESAGRRLALVSGRPGSGKTAIATAVARRLEATGWHAVWGRCPEVEGAPAMWPWTSILSELPGATEAPQLSPLLDGEALPHGDASTGRFRLRRAVATFLGETARSRPLLIVIDDAHRADDGTLDMLVHVLADLGEAPVHVVVTYRDEEASPALRAALGSMAARSPVRVELGPLPDEHVAALILRVADRRLDDEVLAAAVSRSDGNPFYAGELGRLLASGDSLSDVPAGVRDVVRHRVASLPVRAVTVLRMAAVIGRDFDLELLLAVAGLTEEDALDALDAALVAGLVDSDGDRVRFHHVLVRETLYREISPPRRARWHALVAEAVERLRPGDVSVLARHYSAAGAPYATKTRTYAALAAGQAEARFAYAEASALWRQAADTTQDPHERVRLLLELCRTAMTQGNLVGAAAVREQAIATARPTGDQRLLARAITAWQVPTAWQHRRYLDHDPLRVAEIRRLLDTGAFDEAARCRLLCALISELEGTGDPDAPALGREAEALARRSGDPDLIGLAAGARLRLTYLGEPLLERATLAGLLLETGRRHGRAPLIMLGHQASAQVAVARGEVAAFREHLAQVERAARLYGLGVGTLTLGSARGLEHSLAGRFAAAEDAYARMKETMLRGGGHGAEILAVICLTCVREESGGLAGLLPRLEALYDVVPVLSREPYVRMLIELGRVEEAREHWRPDAPVPPDFMGQVWYAFRAGNAIALDDQEVARRTYDVLLPYRGQLAGAISGSMTLAPVAHYLGDLAVYQGRPEAAELYGEALALARKAGAGHYVARAAAALERCAGMRGEGEVLPSA